MPTPFTRTSLIEQPRVAALNDAPKAHAVFLLGVAAQGPTEPVEFHEADAAYKVYGNGPLAREIANALEGARRGGEAASNSKRGRVIARRLETGSAAAVALSDADDNVVYKITTATATDRSNSWTVAGAVGSRPGLVFTNGDTGVVTTVFAAENATATSFADDIRAQTGLVVEVIYGASHFEFILDGTSPLLTSSTEQRSVVTFNASDAEDAIGGAHSTLWIDRAKANDTAGGARAAVSAVYEGTEESPLPSRVYAITAGAVVQAPKGAERVRVEGMAPARAIGPVNGKTLLNIRTTGAGGSAVALADATKRSTAVVSEGYYRVRRAPVGRLPIATVSHEFTTGVATDAYAIVFDAPWGMADNTGAIATAYAATQTSMTAAQASVHLGAELGTDFFQLYAREVGSQSLVRIPLDIAGGGEGIESDVTWNSTTKKITVYLSKSEMTSTYGAAYAESELFVTYDSCTIDLVEKRPATLNPAATGLEYATENQTLVFNKALPHALVVRPMRVTQYVMGDTVTAEKVGATHVFTFHGAAQIGEGGGAFGATGSGMETVLGFEYTYQPEIPTLDPLVDGTVSFTGGSSGVNASQEAKARALYDALAKSRDVEARITVPVEIYADDVREGFDPISGVRRLESLGVLDIIANHQANLESQGSAGLFYVGVRPLRASLSTKLYSDAAKMARYYELSINDSADQTRLGTMLAQRDLRKVFLFDTVFRSTVTGAISTSPAFFAGLRSALPNRKALYTVQLPRAIVEPVYRYDVPLVDVPSALSDARVNTWSALRGSLVLADERSAAGFIINARGEQEISFFRSGVAVLAATEFEQRANAALRNMLGPVPRGGADLMREGITTELRQVAGTVDGIDDIRIRSAEDITLVADAANAIRIKVRVMLFIAGEVREIELAVSGSTSMTTPTVGTIPTAA